VLYILLQLRADSATGLFNKPARLFVLDASRCLFKYLRNSICYGGEAGVEKKEIKKRAMAWPTEGCGLWEGGWLARGQCF